MFSEPLERFPNSLLTQRDMNWIDVFQRTSKKGVYSGINFPRGMKIPQHPGQHHAH